MPFKLLPALLLAGAATAERIQSSWGQCAGSKHAGPTACPSDNYCKYGNPWYSQCVPGSADSGMTTTLVPDPVYAAPDADAILPAPANAKRAATPTILAKDQYWIRAVESPNFHKYLQTSPANSVGTAILASSKTAGQFNIVDGQLVESTGGTPLYLQVEKPADLTQRTLATWFNTTKNEFGTFVFQGDAVTWSTPEITRQNLAAWLVCKNSALFINTGAYGYQTPSGCADETIHFYNGATAND